LKKITAANATVRRNRAPTTMKGLGFFFFPKLALIYTGISKKIRKFI
jgi:hypothetical protein